ncbi:MAG: MT-A70 family methyltransferase [Methylococcaceae bacterium]|jgi:N6-adenosine-specific RNA methylase IME4
MNNLTKYDTAKKALQLAVSVDEVKDIIDKSVAMAAYAKQAKDTQLIGYANEIRARAERKAGELLLVMEKAKGTAGGGNANVTGGSKIVPPVEQPKTLEEQGITKKQSSAWQNVARIPEEKFESEVIERVRTGEVSINEAYKKGKNKTKEAVREEKRRVNAEKIVNTSTENIFDADLKFSTILLDPPWDWGDEGDVNQMGRAKPDYSTMPFSEILNLPVDSIADDDCHIYLWITNRSLPKGFELLGKWGFRYITMLTWPKPSFGMGKYFRGQTEHILFGVKGSLPLKRKDASTLLPSWARGKNGHSSKPLEIYDYIESCSPGAYIELFAREKRDGWSSWGEKSTIG